MQNSAKVQNKLSDSRYAKFLQPPLDGSRDITKQPIGPIFLLLLPLSMFMDALNQLGKRYELGERGSLLTGGGWKRLGNQVISAEHFRKRVEEVFGIPEVRCSDIYGMVEMNAMISTCRGGHYYHIPYTWLKPFVLDHTLTPVGYGKRRVSLSSMPWHIVTQALL